MFNTVKLKLLPCLQSCSESFTTTTIIFCTCYSVDLFHFPCSSSIPWPDGASPELVGVMVTLVGHWSCKLFPLTCRRCLCCHSTAVRIELDGRMCNDEMMTDVCVRYAAA